VLAGVAVLSGAAASFPVALAVGGAYVAGMVTPLAVIALIWDARRERATRALTDKTIVLRWGAHRRTLALGTAISGALMIAMGVLAIVLAVTGPGMPSGGWQTELSGWLQHISASTLHALSWLPGWAVIAILAAVFAILIGRALRRASNSPGGDGTDVDVTASTQEEQQ
jgi:cytochrome c-type biogenesis protein